MEEDSFDNFQKKLFEVCKIPREPIIIEIIHGFIAGHSLANPKKVYKKEEIDYIFSGWKNIIAMYYVVSWLSIHKKLLYDDYQKNIKEIIILLNNIEKEKIQDYIKQNLKYKEFLLTDYWKILSSYSKDIFKSCVLCNSKNNLNIHHRTYKNIGFEILNIFENLTCLCNSCHKKHHNIKEVNNE